MSRAFSVHNGERSSFMTAAAAAARERSHEGLKKCYTPKEGVKMVEKKPVHTVRLS